MKFQLEHMDKDLFVFVDGSKITFDRISRNIAVRLCLMGVIQKSELKYATVLAKRTIGEYNRTKGKEDETYTEEMYVYGTPFKTAYAYLVENFNHFFTRFKYLIKTYGEENVDIHRMGENYSADSVVAILKEDHIAVHAVKYVTLEFIDGCFYPQKFNSKGALGKAYRLSKEELDVGLCERYFMHENKRIQIKIIPSSVEPSFEKHKESTQDFIRSLTRSLEKTSDLTEKKALEQQIKLEQKELRQYNRLIRQDELHKQNVAKLKGVNPDEAWNDIARSLKEQYQNQKKAVLKLIKDEPVDLFTEERRIDYELFFKITTEIIRIDNILKDLKRYDYEFEEYCILVKTKGTKAAR
ncbi:hypothetical protein FQ087_02885 [Sporosarcina sp. ANT_H38]|uniref:hypothetical protein n=1 Tax=Sporosarcina sp. ANT_H38 TaxID=2597358 RepID=UPI0011F24E86|nr:hypothetical protein [Sporosarcina sp. ANT_H38]KAA0965270.1 hypothetical protein FQ087_02885 [Sporosarcina sp. ANT_H38]